MNRRLVVVLGFAAAISAAASFLLYRLLGGAAKARKEPASVQLVVAARPLKVGATIQESDVKLVKWTAAAPALACHKKEDAIGRGVIAEILESEPVVEARLAAKGAGGGLPAKIPPGMRAVAIRVNDVVSVAGFVQPGSHVDVLMSATPPRTEGGPAGKMTRTILQNLTVLSVGTEIDKDAEGKPVNVPVMNLLATPEQAEILSLASNEARIQLVLRNPIDTQTAATPGTAMEKLLFPNAKPAADPPPRRAVQAAATPRPQPQQVAFRVEVFHGAKRSDASFSPVEGAKP